MVNEHYLNRYEKLIEYRKHNTPSKDCYTEKHHIIPKCMGGADEEDNLVVLTGREHFIAHYLLAKSYKEHENLWYAFNMMSRICEGKSILYESARKYIRECVKNDTNRGIKISKALSGRVRSKEHCKAISLSKMGKSWGKHSKERNRKQSQLYTGRQCYHELESGKTRWLKKDDKVPEGFVKGPGPKMMEAAQKRKKVSSWFTNPQTNENIRLGENDKVPEGFVKGRYRPKYKCCDKMMDAANLSKHRKSGKCRKVMLDE